MAGVHVNVQQQWRIVLLERAQPGDVLGRLPIHYLRVVEAGLDQHGRNPGGIHAFQVVVGRVVQHVFERSLLIRIAPLFVLGHGQRKGCIQHGVHDVHERNVREDDAEELRAHVDDCAHEQTAGASAFDRYPVRRAVPFLDKVLHHGDEVREGVLLHHHLARVVPGIAKLSAAADMRVGQHDAAVQQAEARGAEADRKGVAVGAVSVDVERVFTDLQVLGGAE